MPINDPETGYHPEELLSAFVLDTLSSEETDRVEAHLDLCPQCRLLVAEWQDAVAELGRAVPQHTPPPGLQSRVMEAVAQATPPGRDAAATPSRRRAAAAAPSRPRVPSPILSLAAVVMLALLGLSLAMNVHLSGRVGQLERESSLVSAWMGQEHAALAGRLGQVEQENSTLRANLRQSQVEETQVLNSVRQLQLASYWLADPETHPVTLEPLKGISGSQGVLLVTNDGRRAILMVAVIEGGLAPSSTYRVWLIRQGYRVSVGQVKVDSSGWGTMVLYLPEPLFRFDRLELTADRVIGSNSDSDQMVLWAKITSPKPKELTPAAATLGDDER